MRFTASTKTQHGLSQFLDRLIHLQHLRREDSPHPAVGFPIIRRFVLTGWGLDRGGRNVFFLTSQ